MAGRTSLTPSIGSKLVVPFANTEWDLGIFYIPVMMFILVGTVNSANLLDGVDGLCAGVTTIVMLFFCFVCLRLSKTADESYLKLALLPAALS